MFSIQAGTTAPNHNKHYTTIHIVTNFPTTSYDEFHNVIQGGASLSVVSKITLANGLAYTFDYDPNFGEVTQINLPTPGGYIKYKWITIPMADLGPADPLNGVAGPPAIDARRISQRIVSDDGTVGSEKAWTYTYSSATIPTNYSTTITDPLGNSENHWFSQCFVGGFTSLTGQPSVDGGVSYSDSNGKLLKTVVNGWACDRGPLYIAYPGLNLPDANALLTEGVINLRATGSTTTLVDTNQVSGTQTDFNDCYNYSVFNLPYTTCRPNPTETREYDYGTGTLGTLLRTTDFTYLHNSNSAYLNAHIWDKALLKSVYSGSSSGGTLVAQTQYRITTRARTITPFSGATNHDDTNYSPSNTLRGNVTSVSRWLNTTGQWLTTLNVYNQVGNLVQTTDPGGHTYTLSYADNYLDGTNRNSQAFLTSVTSPTTANGVAHVEGKQYNWYTPATMAVCGQNAPSPATCSSTQGLPAADYARYTYDIMGRPATVTHGDGGVTNFTFQESSFPFSVSSSSAIDGTNTLVNTALIDGLGRVTQTQLNSDPDGADFVDTTYDAAGRKYTVSNPHRSGGSSTDGITTYQYDPLGRTSLVIPPDGTTTSNNVSTTYSGNSVTVVDQAGKERRSFTDALGRLTEVDEPSAPAGATVSNGYLTDQRHQNFGAAARLAVMRAHRVGGFEQSYNPGQVCQFYDCGGNCIMWQNLPTEYDTGFVSITVGTQTISMGYGSSDTASGIAYNLANSINNTSNFPVYAVPSHKYVSCGHRAQSQGSRH